MVASDEGIFLKNCWYVAAWDHELIDGAKLARTILEDAGRRSTRARAARSSH